MKLEGIRKVHLLGIAGSGMASLAGLLAEAGYRVTGSDQGIYPPASDLLEDAGIPVHQGWDPKHLNPRPDLVVVGNAVQRGNPELEAVLDLDLAYMSMPETLRWLFLRERTRVVVAGTHGKTTTTTLISWILHKAERSPGYLIGGTPFGLARAYALGKPRPEVPFVLEGDEYDTAFFDKGPKFMHYRPHVLVLNNVEYDHADIYPTPDAYRFVFGRLAMLPPGTGRMFVGGESPDALEASRKALCPVETFGIGSRFHWAATDLDEGPEGVSFHLHEGDRDLGRVQFPMTGSYSVRNALAAWAACNALGLDPDVIRSALAEFPGLRRRMELRGEVDGVRVLDDFAHHPTAIREVIAAARARYPESRLWAVFEPRSWSCRRNTHQAALPEAFSGADRVVLAPVRRADSLTLEERLDTARVASALEEMGVPALAAGDLVEIESFLLNEARRGDVLLLLSNGSFDSLHGRLLEGLEKRKATAG